MRSTGIHIVFLCSRLDLPGGIERAVVNTANLFAAHGHRVTLLILDDTSDSFYPVSKDVHLHHLALSFGITATGNPVSRKLRMLTDVLKLRKSLKFLHPTTCIATEYPFASALVLSGFRRKSKLVSWEHHHMNELEKNAFWDRVFRFTYPRLHQVICLNPDEKQLYSVLNERTEVIPNFVDIPPEPASLDKKMILTVCRLNHVKGIDLLIKVATKLLQIHTDWSWKIIGHGRLDEELRDEISRSGLEGRIIVQPPVSHDISEEYRNASLYVMTSRNECFPMTLLEALSYGLPCVAFDCETGPRHIIKDGFNGYLVPNGDLEKMITAVEGLISVPQKRIGMGENAAASLAEFTSEKIYGLWKQIVLEPGEGD